MHVSFLSLLSLLPLLALAQEACVPKTSPPYDIPYHITKLVGTVPSGRPSDKTNATLSLVFTDPNLCVTHECHANFSPKTNPAASPYRGYVACNPGSSVRFKGPIHKVLTIWNQFTGDDGNAEEVTANGTVVFKTLGMASGAYGFFMESGVTVDLEVLEGKPVDA